jgi:pimeloyl-ACP methyl ester carboxylesterase
VLLLASACATPIGVTRGDVHSVYRSLTGSVVSAGAPSTQSEEVLRRLALDKRFEDDPEATLAELRGNGRDLNQDRLFALAELSYFYAEASKKQAYYLSAAVYAYAFLIDSTRRGSTGLDPRIRMAADLYNLGLSFGLKSPDSEQVILSDRTLPLPFGTLELHAKPGEFVWGGYELSRFIQVMDLEVRGLRNRYRQPGIGAPLAAEVTPIDGANEVGRKRIPARIKVPVTAFVRLDDVFDGIADGRVEGWIEIYAADEDTTVEVNGRKVPLQLEPTATLAYGLEGAPIWDTELGGFLSPGRQFFGDGLGMLHPYRAGRVPVVLVHGTASSPGRWAEMVNELQNDPVLRNRIQLWFFTYNTSNPILFSANQLREALTNVVKDLDPEGRDPALREMVLIGHSQGGLLIRLMVTDSGSAFWNNVSDKPLSELSMTPETRAVLQESMFFKPLPFVRTVIFIATPHRGSFRVTSLVLNLVRRLITFPVKLVKDFGDLAKANPNALPHDAVQHLPTAVDNMRPGHPFVKALSSLPIADGVAAYSIVATLGAGPLSSRTDGVVAYESAHLDGVVSEKIVRSSHSVQANPEAILEVRRILRQIVGEP